MTLLLFNSELKDAQLPFISGCSGRASPHFAREAYAGRKRWCHASTAKEGPCFKGMGQRFFKLATGLKVLHENSSLLILTHANYFPNILHGSCKGSSKITREVPLLMPHDNGGQQHPLPRMTTAFLLSLFL